MNETPRTTIYVAVAVVLVIAAFMSTPGEVHLDFLEDTGTEFFPDFDDSGDATELAVIEFDQERSAALPFNVRRHENGLWTIPSHSDYPADASTRMAQAATLVIGLKKASVRSNSRADHKAFGVVNPMDDSLDLEGRGTRVTFKNASGAVLADLILGNEIEGRMGQRYVRLPDENVTYTAELTAEVSTRFEDWIETGLLDVSSLDMTGLTFDNYSIDEVRGALVPGERLDLQKVDGAWQLEGLADDEELDTAKISTAVTSLTNLKIVGVRAKPEGLSAALKAPQGFNRSVLMQLLQDKGYFLSGDNLFSNEGDLLVMTDKGVVYTLKFGEIVFGTGNAVTAGTGAPQPDAVVGPDPGPQPVDGSHRYLMITADFDEALLNGPEGEPLPDEHLDKRRDARNQIQTIVDAVNSYQNTNDNLPENLIVLTQGDEPALTELPMDPWESDYVFEPTEEGFVIRSLAEDKAPGGEGVGADISSEAFDAEDALRGLATELKAHATKVEEGQEEAASLSDRFGPWYYVIDAGSFAELHLGRTDLVKKKDG